MKMYGFYFILYLMVLYIFDICYSKCDEYVIVFQEITCEFRKMHFLKPITLDEIKWDELTYPYNTTDIYNEIQGYKECMVHELNCNGSELSCLPKIKTENLATHIVIPGSKTIDHIRNMTDKLNVPKNNVSESEKPNHIVNEEIKKPLYDVNLIYVHENALLNSSEIYKKSKNVIQCDYAEIVCIHDKHDSIINIKNSFNTTRYNETAGALEISIQRDLNSTVQPIFTGYNPQVYYNFNSEYLNSTKVKDLPFENLKIVTFTCTLKDHNCNKNNNTETVNHINVYVNTNYIQNNTRTKYFNCTDSSAKDNTLILTCDAKEFANHNQNILLTPKFNNNTEIKPKNQTNKDSVLIEKTKVLIWNCQIIKLNHTEKQHDYNLMFLKNCSIDRNKNTSDYHNTTLIIENGGQIIANTTTKYGFKFNNTRISLTKIDENKDNSSSTYKENIITIHIAENENNCSQNSTYRFDEGKIIDLRTTNNKNELLEKDVLELKLSNCINIKPTVENNTQTDQQTELAIVVNNDSSNFSYLKFLNSTPTEAYIKKIIVLQCDRPNHNLSDISENKTVLDCEFIDLIENNIIGFQNINDSTELNNTSNDKGQKKHNIDKVEQHNHNQTKFNIGEIENRNCSSDKTAALNKCNNNHTSNENVTKGVENKEKHNDNLSKDKSKKRTLNVNTGEIGNRNCSSNKTVALIECNDNHTSNENVTQRVENKEKQKDNLSKDKSKIRTFNRKKDIPKGSGQNSLDIESDETGDKIIHIVIASVAGASLLMALALRKCPIKKEYNPAPTREPPDDEETAF